MFLYPTDRSHVPGVEGGGKVDSGPTVAIIILLAANRNGLCCLLWLRGRRCRHTDEPKEMGILFCSLETSEANEYKSAKALL